MQNISVRFKIIEKEFISLTQTIINAMRYSDEDKEKLFKKVIAKLSAGISLRQFIGKDGMPSRFALYSWLDKDEKLQERFARAQLLGDEVLFEETLEIARTPLEGKTVEVGPNGVTVKTSDMLGHRKLLIETIDKILARRNPRKYGTKVDVTSLGEHLNMPPIVGMVIKNETPANEGQDEEYDL